MKPTSYKPATLSLLFCLAIIILYSCKKEEQQAVAPPVTDEAINIKSMPLTSGSPAAAQKVEETAGAFFPDKAPEMATTETIGTTDFVDFDDEMALTILPDHAASTFATAPFYIQQVGNAWVHVKENNTGNYKPAFKSNYGHFHLSYQNFEPCITQNGKFGKPVNGACANINPVKEPRVLFTHDGDHWIKIYAYDYSNPSRVFDLLGIKVTKSPIQLWFKQSGGDWLHWSSIGAGTWNLSAYCTSIKEVLISSTGNTGPIGFDDVKVLMPYL